jgi:ASCH domain
MKTLTIKQPFASLICSGEKDVENRTWKTGYRGYILIHAGKGKSDFQHDIDYIPTGAIIGAVEIVDIVENSSSPWAMKNNYHWILKNPILFRDPIVCNGQLSLWNYPLNPEKLLYQ